MLNGAAARLVIWAMQKRRAIDFGDLGECCRQSLAFRQRQRPLPFVGAFTEALATAATVLFMSNLGAEEFPASSDHVFQYWEH